MTSAVFIITWAAGWAIGRAIGSVVFGCLWRRFMNGIDPPKP